MSMDQQSRAAIAAGILLGLILAALVIAMFEVFLP